MGANLLCDILLYRYTETGTLAKPFCRGLDFIDVFQVPLSLSLSPKGRGDPEERGGLEIVRLHIMTRSV